MCACVYTVYMCICNSLHYIVMKCLTRWIHNCTQHSSLWLMSPVLLKTNWRPCSGLTIKDYTTFVSWSSAVWWSWSVNMIYVMHVLIMKHLSTTQGSHCGTIRFWFLQSSLLNSHHPPPLPTCFPTVPGGIRWRDLWHQVVCWGSERRAAPQPQNRSASSNCVWKTEKNTTNISTDDLKSVKYKLNMKER